MATRFREDPYRAKDVFFVFHEDRGANVGRDTGDVAQGFRSVPGEVLRDHICYDFSNSLSLTQSSIKRDEIMSEFVKEGVEFAV